MATGLSGLPAIAVEPQRFAAACALREASRKPAETMAMASAEVLVRPDCLPGDGRDLMARVSVVTQALPIAAARVVLLATLATGPGSSRFWASGVPHAGSWPWSCGAASWRCCAPALCSGSCSAPHRAHPVLAGQGAHRDRAGRSRSAPPHGGWSPRSPRPASCWRRCRRRSLVGRLSLTTCRRTDQNDARVIPL